MLLGSIKTKVRQPCCTGLQVGAGVCTSGPGSGCAFSEAETVSDGKRGSRIYPSGRKRTYVGLELGTKLIS